MSSPGGVRPSAIGGQNNELGSAYRAGVAAYLAAHALASQAARHIGIDESSTPLVIKVESDEAVDDLLCEMPVGVLLVQAKRACGIDARFRSAVDQWVAVLQEDGLKPQSQLILVTGMATQPLLKLQEALERRRNPDAQQLGTRERAALTKLISLVGDRLSNEQLTALLDAAMIIQIAVEGPGDAAFREAARLLEGTVVSPGDGLAAMQALQHHFQNLGARRWASNREAWRQALRDASLALLEDSQGGWSARRTAIEREVDRYRSQLSARIDELPLNLLSLDLPPLHIENLASTFQAALPNDRGSQGLSDICRRWGRVVVAGLPGSGKSTFLEQLGATWASRDEAPIPIIIRLRSLLRRVEAHGVDISLTALVDHAVRSPGRDASILVPELIQRCQIGEAALLFDGLDECRRKAGWVADAIVKIVEALPGETSVILTTRKSTLPAASKLRLPEVELVEPYRLEATLDLLLEHVARHRITEPDRRAWIKERARQLEDVRRETSQLLQVPLMAVLLTLIVAENGLAALGTGRAALLSEVVKDSVKRWESQKATVDPSSPAIEPGMLLDAYSEVGHVLTESPNTTRVVAEKTVATQFETEWGLPSRRASEAAEAAVFFWDDRVGVFVSLPPDGTIEPRSRVFVEIAEAMWVARQAEPVVCDWLRGAVAETDRQDTVMLAAGLNPRVAELLVEKAARDGAAPAIAIASDALGASKAVASSTRLRLLELFEARINTLRGQVGDSPEDTDHSDADGGLGKVGVHQTRREGPIWPMARRLAQLSLDEPLRNRRDRILATLETHEQRILARALSAVTDVAARGGDPSDDEIRHMVRLLREPVPESGPKSRRVSRRHLVIDSPSWSPLSGFGDALVECVHWLPHIDEDLARLAWRAAQRTSFRHAIRIERLLAQSGHGKVMAETNRKQFAALANLRFHNPWDEMRPYYEIVATAAPPSDLTLIQAWRLENLSDLTELMTLRELQIGDLQQAISRARADMEFLLPLCTARAGFNAEALAAEAKIAAEAHDRGLDREIVHLLFVPPQPGREVSLRPAAIADDLRERLIPILRCGVELPFVLALRLLFVAGTGGVSEQVLDMIDTIPPWHRRRAARLVVATASNPADAVIGLASHDDGIVRVSAAGMVAEMVVEGEDDGRLRQALEEIAASRDLAIRAAMFAESATQSSDAELERLLELAVDAPECWTCSDCGREQPLVDLDCGHCRTGTRPDLPDKVRRRFRWYTHPL